jgi:hypothetical protein
MPAGVLQLTKDGVTHLAFHPTCNDLLVAAGDKQGKVSLWQVGRSSVMPMQYPSLEDTLTGFAFDTNMTPVVTGVRLPAWQQGCIPLAAICVLFATI